MRKPVWTGNDIAIHKAYLESETGKRFIENLVSMRMLPTCDVNPHSAHYRLGAISGYEQSIENAFSLTLNPPEPKKVVQANYGVKKPEEKPSS